MYPDRHVWHMVLWVQRKKPKMVSTIQMAARRAGEPASEVTSPARAKYNAAQTDIETPCD